MQKTICKVVYDTENATEVFKYTKGFFGDAEGYEEILYVTAEGKYFVYGNGGEASIYPEAKIARIAKDKTEAWIAERK